MLHTNFLEIGLPVPEKKIFKGFLTYTYGHEGHLGYVTSVMSSDFHFLVPESSHKKMVQIGKVVSEKIQFEFFCMYTTLGQGQEMTLIFNTHIPSYIELDVCSY